MVSCMKRRDPVIDAYSVSAATSEVRRRSATFGLLYGGWFLCGVAVEVVALVKCMFTLEGLNGDGGLAVGSDGEHLGLLGEDAAVKRRSEVGSTSTEDETHT